MKKKDDDFIDKRIEEMISEEQNLEKKIFLQNSLTNMSPSERITFILRSIDQNKKEKDSRSPFQKFYWDCNSVERVFLTLGMIGSCIYPIVLVMAIKNPSYEGLIGAISIMMVITITGFSISKIMKNERRNN